MSLSSVPVAHAAVCARGVYRAGCAVPNGAVVARRALRRVVSRRADTWSLLQHLVIAAGEMESELLGSTMEGAKVRSLSIANDEFLCQPFTVRCAHH